MRWSDLVRPRSADAVTRIKQLSSVLKCRQPAARVVAEVEGRPGCPWEWPNWPTREATPSVTEHHSFSVADAEASQEFSALVAPEINSATSRGRSTKTSRSPDCLVNRCQIAARFSTGNHVLAASMERRSRGEARARVSWRQLALQYAGHVEVQDNQVPAMGKWP